MTLVESTDVAKRLRDCWLNALKQPAWPGPSTWIHGDLHPLNLIWNDDRLAAVIDFGDITAGDPACDLAVAWYLFGHEQHGPARRRQFRATAQIGGRAVDDATWSRAMGWALGVAAAIATNSADHPVLNQLAKRTLLAVAYSDH